MAVKRRKLLQHNSTNRYLAELLKESPDTGPTLVIADYQREGRGQGANRWQSNPGENLLMSLLLFPAFLSASDQFYLSRVASLALIDMLGELGLKPTIKWPNDILVNKKKIAGILIENGISGSRLSHTIFGIGLNLNQTSFPDFPLKACSVATESGASQDRDRVADLLLDRILARYGQLERGELSRLEEDYLAQLFLKDQQGTFADGDGQFSGIIRGIGDHGVLLLERDGLLRSYTFQEIHYIPEGD